MLFVLDGNGVPSITQSVGTGEIWLGWACEDIRLYNGMFVVVYIVIGNSE